MVTTIYYEADGDLDAIAGERIAVVGYGNQGRSWALESARQRLRTRGVRAPRRVARTSRG